MYLLYGKRTGLPDSKTGKPIYDKTFRALDSFGCRVTKLTDAMAYAEKADVQSILDQPHIKANIENGFCQFEIRKAK